MHTVPAKARSVFIVSDGTGVTAETFSHSILSQFEIKFRIIKLPFVDNADKAREVVMKINDSFQTEGVRPIVFSTLVNPDVNRIVATGGGLMMDMFQTFIEPIEQELGVKSTHALGRVHQNIDSKAYRQRIEAINFSLAHDDGQSDKNLSQADVILVGVSRSGKTPTSLYMAMQYGIKAANYPLIPEDFERGKLPDPLIPHIAKTYGLSIDPTRLSEIRNERRPGSKYAALDNCRYEVNEAQSLMQREGIKWLSSTHRSIEEIATKVLQELNIEPENN
ncbi:MAG: kinase/pyrophosphorylase [Ottowia sp.]|nr:kinase/pyrophosphorylase [Ottowia sp.]